MINDNRTYRQRLKLWLDERFPPINFISGACIYFLAKAVSGNMESDNQYGLLKEIAASLIPMMHLFLLRVFDEHKDFASDKINYPERVLQKGIFGLIDVRRLGYLAFAIEMISTLYVLFLFDWPLGLGLTCVLLWVWTILMTKEFFARDWLKERFLLYGFTHLLITPILLLNCMALANPYFKGTYSVILSLILSLLTGWLYEVTRKTKAPEEEKLDDKSYSQIFGVNRSVAVIVISLLVTHVVIFFLFKQLDISKWVYWGLGLPLLIVGLLSLLKFRGAPSARNRKKNEQAVSLAALFAYLTPIIYWIWR